MSSPRQHDELGSQTSSFLVLHSRRLGESRGIGLSRTYEKCGDTMPKQRIFAFVFVEMTTEPKKIGITFVSLLGSFDC